MHGRISTKKTDRPNKLVVVDREAGKGVGEGEGVVDESTETDKCCSARNTPAPTPTHTQAPTRPGEIK